MTPSEKSCTVRTKVSAVLPEFKQVRVATAGGFQYAITDKTSGVDWSILQVGQFVDCTVTESAVPRVLEAHVVT